MNNISISLTKMSTASYKFGYFHYGKRHDVFLEITLVHTRLPSEPIHSIKPRISFVFLRGLKIITHLPHVEIQLVFSKTFPISACHESEKRDSSTAIAYSHPTTDFSLCSTTAMLDFPMKVL